MSSISSTTSQPPFIQVPQSTNKPDSTKDSDSSNAQSTQSTQSTQTTQATQVPAQTTASGSVNGIPESKYTRNSDGTFGPAHTVLAPFNPNKPSTNDSADTQASDSADVGVNVQI